MVVGYFFREIKKMREIVGVDGMKDLGRGTKTSGLTEEKNSPRRDGIDGQKDMAGSEEAEKLLKEIEEWTEEPKELSEGIEKWTEEPKELLEEIEKRTEEPEEEGTEELEDDPEEDDFEERESENNRSAREERIKRREEERTRRRIRRRRIVMLQRIAVIMVLAVLVCGVGGIIALSQSSTKLSRRLTAGDKYTRDGDYELAKVSYEEAIEIDPTTVKAYRALAENYMKQEDAGAAKDILYAGWQAAQDENLLHYYCTIILNEVVVDLNNDICTYDTVEQCMLVLQNEPDNRDAFSLLEVCRDRLFAGDEQSDSCTMFLDETDSEDTCQYGTYETYFRSLMALYEANPSEELRTVLVQFALPKTEYLHLGMTHLENYHILLEEAGALLAEPQVTELAACLARAIEVEADFAEMFLAFEQEDFAKARDFIVSSTYQEIRDAFLAGQGGCWEGANAIPINKERLVIHKTEQGFQFFWPGYEDYENPKGVITVWGSRQLDDGVQRTTISYEPAGTGTEYYPHTEYMISYEYSNVLQNRTAPEMNYRFTRQITTQDGASSEVIGDWGGEHEWEKSY